MKKIYLIILFILIACSNAFSQNKLSSEQLKEDLTILGDIAMGLSPKLTAEDRIRIEQLTQLKKKELDGKTLTTMEFFNFLSAVDFQSKFDEHASISLTEVVLMPLLKKSKLFPLPIKMLGNRVMVNSSNSEVPYGSTIYSINGVSLDSLLNSFTKEYRDPFVKRRLEVQFSIVYLIKEGNFESFQIEYTVPSNPNKKLEKSIAGIDFETYREVFSTSIFPLERPKLQNLINTQFYPDARTYYLQLNSFNWDRSSKKSLLQLINSEHKNFEKKFKTIFKEISNYEAENLIIDLRFNSGGNVKVPGVLYSFIARDSFTEDISISMQNFEIPNIELVKKISGDKVDDSKEVKKFIKRYKKQFSEKGDSTHVWKLVDNEEREPSSKAFKGNVYLLVGGKSISSSAYFAALFLANDRGLIVGEEMGGSYRSLSAGQILTYELPNSKLELQAPIMEVNFSSELYEKINDLRIKPHIEFNEEELQYYFVEKRDIDIEKVLERIKADIK